jgi:hypothetical protein
MEEKQAEMEKLWGKLEVGCGGGIQMRLNLNLLRKRDHMSRLGA